MAAENLRRILEEYRQEIKPVLPFDPAKDRICALDLSVSNREINDKLFGDITSFSRYIDDHRKKHNARYCIGGYNEHRGVYASSEVFDAAQGKSPRRIHLGVDIWGAPHTAVMTPLDAIVHSFANNDRPGDYGGTIILVHEFHGTSFYTLYGHLSLNSLKNLEEGSRLSAGDVFADFGIPSENGQWPPHLHFQIILDIGNYNGDYPGVCAKEDREKFLANCPEPDLLLRLHRFTAGN
jgi:murein DD-endopeptidase MepM/ murein hydrolase activator NlpD